MTINKLTTTIKPLDEVDKINEIIDGVNCKADVDLSNISNTSGFRKLIDIYSNGSSWYKVFNEYNPSTGDFVGKWCEQGGVIPAQTLNPTTVTITFLKTFVDTNYHITKSVLIGSYASNAWDIRYTDFITKTTQNCSTWMSTSAYSQNATWIASGYIN